MRRAVVMAFGASILLLVGCSGHGRTRLSGTIAFARTHSTASTASGYVTEIVLMKPDGSGSRTIATGGDWKAPMRWSPRGRMLAFSMLRRNYRLYAFAFSDRKVHRITRPKYEADMNPAWSPSARRLVFDAQGDGWTDLRVVNADGTHERKLAAGSYVTGNSATINGGDAWSPDGRKILYNNRGGRLAVMKPDGTHRRRLKGPIGGGEASWSPNGREIVFYGNGLEVVNRDGTGRRRIADDGAHPVWSPDGNRIVFVVKGFIYVVNRDGGGRTRVAVGGDRPSWSPDGQWIVYAKYQRDQGDIWVVRPDGTDERQLTNTKLDDADPVWSPVR